MGTTLTGTTPQDTYDSLIKVTDNGPLSGTAKFLSDGLGNDSVLALSTTAVGIGTATPVSKANILATKTTALTTAADFLTLGLTIDDSTAFNNVGVGGGIVFRGKRNSGGDQTIYSAIDSSKEDAAADDFRGALRFYTNQNSTGVPLERMRITSAGNVGIGTSAPPADTNLAVLGNFQTGFYRNVTSGNRGYFLHLGANTASGTLTNAASLFGTLNSGDADGSLDIQIRSGGTLSTRVSVTPNGLTFNGDTAAANALDDYEEGTWTMGVSFGGASVGVTYNGNTGTYTKIGRQVTVNGFVRLTNKGSSTGAAAITGLPFTIGVANSNYSSPSLNFKDITFTNQFQGESTIGNTTISLQEITVLGTLTNLTDADFANTSYVILSLTYFV